MFLRLDLELHFMDVWSSLLGEAFLVRPRLPALVIQVHSHLSFLHHTALFRSSTCMLILSVSFSVVTHMEMRLGAISIYCPQHSLTVWHTVYDYKYFPKQESCL